MSSRERLVPIAWWVAPAVLAAVIALELSRPFRAGPIAFDSGMAVLHFQRILEGRHLEGFVASTPKPLLTAIYGPLFGLTHDWRVLTWAAILAFGVGVSLATALARRIGGWAAGIFAAVALAGAPTLLYDASLALATPWALLLWAIAGLAVTTSKPRYVVAGIALGLSSLARLESLVVIAAVLAAMIVVSVAPGQFRRQVPRGSWWIAIGLVAVPAMMVHDGLLTGDPFFWLSVSARYSELTRIHVPGLREVGNLLATRYLNEGGLLVLAVIGWIRLAAQRQLGIAIGLLALGPGIAAFLLLLAARHTFVSDRYFAGIDVAMVFAAAIGIKAISVDLPGAISSWAADRPLVRKAAVPTVVAVLAVALSSGWSGLGTDLLPTIRRFTNVATSERLAVPILRRALPSALAASKGDPNRVVLLVPTQLRPGVVVDLGLSLGQVESADPSSVDVAAGHPGPGQLLLQSTAAGTSAGLKQIEVGQPTKVGSATVVPLLADAASHTWVVRIDGGG